MSSVEETALAVEALLPFVDRDPRAALVVQDGLQWLMNAVEEKRHFKPSPIGFYFAKLWYYEELYPLVFAASALAAATQKFSDHANRNVTNSPVTAT